MRTSRGAGRWARALLPLALLASACTPGDDDAPVPPPALEVAPSADLVDGQTVAVRGSGFVPNRGVEVALCDPGLSSCAPGSRFAVADADRGAFAVDLSVEAVFGALDCRASAGACVVAAFDGGGIVVDDGREGGGGALVAGVPPALAVVPVSFDPDAPLRPPGTLTVEPATGLVDGQEVQVAGAGLRPTTPEVLRQCAAGAVSTAACSDTGEGFPDVVDGAFSTTVTLDVAFSTLAGEVVDCRRAPGACELVVGDVADPLLGAAAPLGFDPAGPFVPPPALSLTPPGGLVDGQTVTVAGTGFRSGSYAELVPCRSGLDDRYLDCSRSSSDYVEPDSGGRFSVPVVLDAVFTAGDGASVDCRAAGACVLLSRGSAGTAVAALAFLPGAPLAAPPALTVDPPEGLLDGQVLTVGGSGFRGNSLGVAQCEAGATDVGRCIELTYAEPDAEGRFSTTVVVDAILEPHEGDPVDCRAVGACELVAGDPLERDDAGVAPLRFDPAGPLRPPSVVTVEPATGLADGQVVTVAATGLRPLSFASVAQCPAGAADQEGCASSNSASRAGTDGSLTLTAAVDAVLRRSEGAELDCRPAPGTCVLVLLGADRVEAPLAFDPDAPLRPPPVVSLEPATGLADGQVVLLRGTGFRPLARIGVLQCPAGTTGGDGCRYAASAPVDAAGALSASVEVRAEVEGVSCRTAAGACELRTLGDVAPAEVPLAFGPAPPPRGRYLDQVFPEVEVTRDILYRTAVDVAGREVELRLDLYQPAGDTATARPAVVWVHGGYFERGSRTSMEGYATDLARRGYVTASISYRLRPGASSDLGVLVPAAFDAAEDATAAVAWLVERAGTYRIDPRAISIGGYSAGALTALHLVHGPDGAAPRPPVAAGIALAGVRLYGTVEAGEPPVLMFHGTADTVVPFGSGFGVCEEVRRAGVLCDFVRYEGVDHGLPFTTDIGNRTADFLAEQVLRPLGVLGGGGPPVAEAGGPYEVVEGSTVRLDGSGSTGTGLAHSWAPADRLDDAAVAAPAYTGVDDGEQVLSLRVTGEGGEDADEATVRVANAVPTTGAVTVEPAPRGRSAVADPRTVRLVAPYADPGTLDTHTVRVDWGDGGSGEVPTAAAARTATGEHRYRRPGTYTVTLTVTDDDGGTATTTRTVTVDRR